uniref:FHA domain-containing protein n=1 Tax=Schlesneria paludicola TaxID=360056 RepID=A0A7C2K3N2_9PLAN
MFDLVVQTGKMEGKRLLLPLGKEIVVGREEGCQIVLHSTLISRQHCVLRRTDAGVVVRDLNSQNGTFVNDVPIQAETLLVAGDTLRIGAIVFEVQPHGAPGSAAAAVTRESAASAVRSAARPVKQQASSGISDHEIAAWLSDHDTATVPAATDTTVIRTHPAPAPAAPVPPAEPAVPIKPPSAQAVPASKPHKFRSVKDEAADIIRRHWARVRGEQPEGSDAPGA